MESKRLRNYSVGVSMWELTKKFFVIPGLVVLLAGLIVWFAISNTSYYIPHDYSHTIIVNDSSKIPLAVSNAMNCVSSKGFVIISLSVSKDHARNKYHISCGGKDLGNLLTYP